MAIEEMQPLHSKFNSDLFQINANAVRLLLQSKQEAVEYLKYQTISLI